MSNENIKLSVANNTNETISGLSFFNETGELKQIGDTYVFELPKRDNYPAGTIIEWVANSQTYSITLSSSKTRNDVVDVMNNKLIGYWREKHTSTQNIFRNQSTDYTFSSLKIAIPFFNDNFESNTGWDLLFNAYIRNNRLEFDGYGWSLTQTLTQASQRVNSVRFSFDGNYIAYASNDNNVYIHQTSDWSLIQTLSQAGDLVREIYWSENNDYIAYGGNDNNVYVHQTSDWSLIQTLSQASDDIYTVVFSFDNNYIAYGGNDNNVYIHQTSDWSLIQTLSQSAGDIVSIFFSPSNSYIAYGGDDNNVYIHQTSDWSLIQTLSQASDAVRSVRFSFDNSKIVYASNDGNVYTHQTSDWSLIKTISNNNNVTSTAFSYDDKYIVYANNDGFLYFYRVSDWRLIYKLDTNNNYTSCWFTTDSNYVVAYGGANNECRIANRDKDYDGTAKRTDKTINAGVTYRFTIYIEDSNNTFLKLTLGGDTFDLSGKSGTYEKDVTISSGGDLIKIENQSEKAIINSLYIRKVTSDTNPDLIENTYRGENVGVKTDQLFGNIDSLLSSATSWGYVIDSLILDSSNDSQLSKPIIFDFADNQGNSKKQVKPPLKDFSQKQNIIDDFSLKFGKDFQREFEINGTNKISFDLEPNTSIDMHLRVRQKSNEKTSKVVNASGLKDMRREVPKKLFVDFNQIEVINEDKERRAEKETKKTAIKEQNIEIRDEDKKQQKEPQKTKIKEQDTELEDEDKKQDTKSESFLIKLFKFRINENIKRNKNIEYTVRELEDFLTALYPSEYNDIIKKEYTKAKQKKKEKSQNKEKTKK